MSGVFSYIAARKRSWLSYFSVFLMLCSVVPLLNSSFFLLNSSYYARWNYMMILMFCVATVIALEDRRISFKRGLIANAVACAVIALPIGLRWYQESEGSDWAVSYTHLGTAENVVPETCSYTVDIRYRSETEGESAMAYLRRVTETAHVSGAVSAVTILSRRSPMPRTEAGMALFDHLRETGLRWGLEDLRPLSNGGGSDAAYTTRCV